MEVFDVVNENDQLVGGATREECHTNPKLIHRALHFTLVDKLSHKILITQRSFELETDPGMWCFAGEHVKTQEAWKVAALRGVKEEFGFSPIQVTELGHHVFAQPYQSEFVRLFVAEWHEEVIKPDPKEIAAVKWVTLEELLASKATYSEMTQYWVKNIDFSQAL